MKGWVLKLTKENIDFINQVRYSQTIFRDTIVLDDIHDYNYYDSVSLSDGFVSGTAFNDELGRGKVEIDFEAFKQMYTTTTSDVKTITEVSQTLTRQELIGLKSVSDCSTWNNNINFILKDNMFNINNDFEISQSVIKLLVNEGTDKQKRTVVGLGIILPKTQKEIYIETQNSSGLKVGDTVEMVCCAKTGDRGWDSSWVYEMNHYIGKTLTIIDDAGANGFQCISRDDSSIFYYPYFVLEKIIQEYDPFAFDDDLLGKHVISKDRSCKGTIHYQTKSSVVIYGSREMRYAELLARYTFLDGTPCGKII